jgi:ElaB/YqjD/DUF883 family membrane-anchored ribosome-binding protein
MNAGKPRITMNETNPETDGEHSVEGAAEATADGGETFDDEQLQESLREQYEELEQRYENARETLEQYNRRTIEFIREHPGICIAGALGAGYLFGRIASQRWLR